jgi:hypothetical protein
MRIDKLSKIPRRLVLVGMTIPLIIYICIVIWVVSFVEFCKTFASATQDSSEAVFGIWQDLWNDPKPIEKENHEDLWSDI